MEFSELLAQNICFSSLSEQACSILSNFLKINSINIFTISSDIKQIRDIDKNWVSLSNEVEKNLVEIAKNLSSNQIYLNEKTIETENIKNETLQTQDNKLFIPFFEKNKIFAIMQLSFDSEYTSISKEAFLIFKIILNQVKLYVLNRVLNIQMSFNVNFYNSMKNIAKIIENQYELNYIIPIIGEMIDRFIPNHLVYVYLKDKNSKFNLIWPGKCRNESFVSLFSSLNSENDYILCENKKTAIFPLVSDNNVLGAIVASSVFSEFPKQDIEYLLQLVKQSSTTIHRANLYSEILKHATLDALTGLNNRRQFEIRLGQEVATAKRKNKNLCCIMLDIDHFKKINDTYGHLAGDCVLKQLGKLIESQLREYDIASRYGGEEFCILLPYTTVEEAKFVSERLRKKVESFNFDISSLELEQKTINATISVGLAEYDRQKIEKAYQLYKNADAALYEAKESGRNKVVVFE